MLDNDFTDKPLKKTKLYKKHKNDYRQKRIKEFFLNQITKKNAKTTNNHPNNTGVIHQC